MRKNVDVILFVLGLVAVIWVAVAHAASNPMVLVVCALIALVYSAGGSELRRYRRATASLQTATKGLTETPADLEPWLQPIDSGLRTAVRLRVAGERIALPAPTLPAYLSGVLVLLGMLGTLLGMMVTLQGTGLALESASDLQAIRDSLAAPVKGLGYAFGTSIAGIATSAVLGVLTALCRRERLAAARALDAAIAGPLHVFTRDHRNDDTWRLMREQSLLMPALVERLQALADTLERRDEAAHTQQEARQEAFLSRSEAAYGQLAERVRSALEESVTQGAQAASSALQPVAQAMMEDIAASAHRMHENVQQSAQQHLQAQSAASGVAWEAAMAQQQVAHNALVVAQQEALQAAAADMQQQAAALLAQIAQEQRASAESIAEQGRKHAGDTIAEISKLMHTASAAPQAAAEVITEMRQALSESMLRDTAMLAERKQLFETLGSLFETMNRVSHEQQIAVAALESSATRAAAGAVEVGSVADAFGAAVETFASSNAHLAERLERVETTLEKTLTRSDEQLAYYVAQAREVVDLSLLAQRQIVDDLRKLDGQRSVAASAA